MGNKMETPNSIYSDEIVELMGWIFTDGSYEMHATKGVRRVCIWQNGGPKADRIRNCLNALGMKFSESTGKNICFAISRADSRTIVDSFPVKNLTMDFINSISTSQRELLLGTLIDGDGWRRHGKYMSYFQKNREHIDVLQALCVMLGRRSSTTYNEFESFGKPTFGYNMNIFEQCRNRTIGENLDFNGGKNSGTHKGQGKINHQNFPTHAYDGRVWCPSTEFGSFVARRNDTIYLTGNSYLEEMKNQSLLQLIQVGLKFDESRSQNPFAYYTTTMTNSFTGVFHKEKRNQNIRDDILIMQGQNPSNTRQIEHEMAVRSK
jgi:ribonucleoside-triphosphate reductase